MAADPDLDVEKLDTFSNEDIQRIKAEDGYAISEPDAVEVVLPPAEIRARLGMTQEVFARALRIPLATLRNWEQGRFLPDPAARSLLNAVAREPEAVLSALAPKSKLSPHSDETNECHSSPIASTNKTTAEAVIEQTAFAAIDITQVFNENQCNIKRSITYQNDLLSIIATGMVTLPFFQLTHLPFTNLKIEPADRDHSKRHAS